MVIQQSLLFSIPRPGDLTADLFQAIQRLDTEADREALRERLLWAAQQIPRVFAGARDVLEQLETSSIDYREGIEQALNDAQQLFENGIEEMLSYADHQDRFHLRYGRLLLEKGEQEYLAVLEAFEQDERALAYLDRRDYLGQLAYEYEQGSIAREDFLRSLEGFERHLQGELEQASLSLKEALELGREFSEGDHSRLRRAQKSLRAVTRLLGKVLVSLTSEG